jgi:hypothetical protein
MQLVWGPFGLGFSFWPVAFFLAAFTERRFFRTALAVVLGLHYIFVIIEVCTTNVSDVLAASDGRGEQVARTIAIASYILVHIGLWARFGVALRRQRSD